MIKTLLLTGENNHDWKRSSAFCQHLLQSSGQFDVVLTTNPSEALSDPAATSAYQLFFIDYFGSEIRLGMPLGLGKPVPLINAIYQRAKNNPQLNLTIFTALSLEKPTWASDLERRFWQPVVERLWSGIPDLDYMLDLRSGGLPDNVTIHELFCRVS